MAVYAPCQGLWRAFIHLALRASEGVQVLRHVEILSRCGNSFVTCIPLSCERVWCMKAEDVAGLEWDKRPFGSDWWGALRVAASRTRFESMSKAQNLRACSRRCVEVLADREER
jgi:hypothetical protein